MPSTTRQAETTAYKNVQSNPFTRAIAEMVAQINPSNPFTQVLAEIAAQIKVLTAAVTQFAAKKENSNPNATRGNGGGDRESRRPHMNKLRNMGGYCFTQWVPAITVKLAGAKKRDTTQRQRGIIDLEGTCFGPPLKESPSNNKTILHGRESWPPPIDRDWKSQAE
jgi:hypothetical protein